MKLYVIPMETKCNGHCPWCTTRCRKYVGNPERLTHAKLRIGLAKYRGKADRIEMTGGGEPLLHPTIDYLPNICTSEIPDAPITLYTNGTLLHEHKEALLHVKKIAVSIVHHDETINNHWMGTGLDFDKLEYALASCTLGKHTHGGYEGTEKKASLVLIKGLVDNADEIIKYAKTMHSIGFEKIVIRELFPGIDNEGFPFYKQYHVDGNEIYSELRKRLPQSGEDIFKLRIDKHGLESILIEYDDKSCSHNSKVLHSDGKICGWDR